MTDSTTTTCVNHPERAAVESCEVCHDPLCAYCLYYTSDGQRLCKTHAAKAAVAGAFIRAPGNYPEGLIASQLDAASNVSRQQTNPDASAAYHGDAVDIIALVGMVLGIMSIALCVPGLCCLVGPIGLVMSAAALVGSKNAHDPVRTRTMATVGVMLSALWVIILGACILAYSAQGNLAIKMLNGNNFPITVIAPGMGQPPPAPTATPTIAPTTRPT